MKKSGKRQEEQGSGLGGLYALLKGSVLALTTALLLLLACSAAASGGWISQSGMERGGMVVCVLASMIGSVMSMKDRRELALPLGLGTGGVLFLMLLCLGTILFENAPALEHIPTILCACLCGGATAGILGRKTKKKRRR